MAPMPGTSSAASRCRCCWSRLGHCWWLPFAFNFNNFTVIELYNNGGRPCPMCRRRWATPTFWRPTPINIAFGAQGTQDYGYASAITMMIFLILFIITSSSSASQTCWKRGGAMSNKGRFTTSVGSVQRGKRIALILRILLAIMMLTFALFPVLWIISASFNPTRIAGRAAADSAQPDAGQLRKTLQRPSQSLPALVCELAVRSHHRDDLRHGDHHTGGLLRSRASTSARGDRCCRPFC
jgi:hypothetical protein